MPRSIRDEAIEWMVKHPHIVDEFARFAKQLLPNRQSGINQIRERVRWESLITKPAGEKFKFPNDYSPYVARYLLTIIPGLDQCIRCKRAKDETEVTLIYEHELQTSKKEAQMKNLIRQINAFIEAGVRLDRSSHLWTKRRFVHWKFRGPLWRQIYRRVMTRYERSRRTLPLRR